MITRNHHPVKKHRLTLLALAVIILVLTVYWHSFSRLIEMWSSSDYEYGWLVYPVSLYLLIRNQDKLAGAPWRTSVVGILLTASVVLAWLVARAVGVQVVEFAGATFLIFTIYWALAGSNAAHVAAFPLLFLLAAVPAADFLVEPLISITAAIASAGFSLTGIPVLRDGRFFVLHGGSFEVADVCSGLRYLLAGTMAALAYAYVTYSSNWKRALFVGITAIILVIANGARAFITMAVASATQMKVLGGEDHVIFGMLLFVVVFIALIWVGEGYADKRGIRRAVCDDPDDLPDRNVSGILIVATLLIVLAGPMVDAVMKERGVAYVADAPFPALSGCILSDGWDLGEAPEFSGAELQKHATYTCRDLRIGVFVASYGEQRQGKELINWNNRILPSDWYPYVRESTINVQTSDGGVDAQEVLVRDPAGRRLIWYWYHVGGSSTGNALFVKLLEAVYVLTLRPVESSVVVVSIIGSGEDTEEEMREQISVHAARLVAWNNDRVALGGPR